MINLLKILLVTIYILKLIFCDTDKTILDYRSTLLPHYKTNETLLEVNLGFDKKTRILAYIDFKSSKKEDKS